jgi:hypothetical protein
MLFACRLASLSALVPTMTASMREGNPAKRTASPRWLTGSTLWRPNARPRGRRLARA